MFRTVTATAIVLATSVNLYGKVNLDVDVSTDNGNVANAVNVTADSYFYGANIYVQLTQGQVINLGPGGVDTAPSQAVIDVVPALLFDTFVGRIGSIYGTLAGAVELGAADTFILGPDQVNANWDWSNGTGPMIGNFVFSDDAEGVWSLGVFEWGMYQAKFIGGTVSGGVLQTDFVPGDLDLDGFTGLDDLDILLDQWNTDGSGDPRSDPTGDQYVGLDDLDILLDNWNAGTSQTAWEFDPYAASGDVNGDGFTGLDDLDIVLINFHKNVTPSFEGPDFDGDGFISIADIEIFEHLWSPITFDAATVPEPMSIGIFSLGVFALLQKRRS